MPHFGKPFLEPVGTSVQGQQIAGSSKQPSSFQRNGVFPRIVKHCYFPFLLAEGSARSKLPTALVPAVSADSAFLGVHQTVQRAGDSSPIRQIRPPPAGEEPGTPCHWAALSRP